MKEDKALNKLKVVKQLKMPGDCPYAVKLFDLGGTCNCNGKNIEVCTMLGILLDYASKDYNVVKSLIPYVYSESLAQYNTSFNFDYDKSDLKFIIADKIFWFLNDNTDWDGGVDMDIVVQKIDEYYEEC